MTLYSIFVILFCFFETCYGACKQNSTCKSLQNSTTCFGVNLPFTHTLLEFATDSSTLDEVNEKLKLWEGLKYVPECWALIQPFLCSVYLPKCDSGEVELPSKELCKKIKSPCKIVEIYRGAWPDFLDCDENHFMSNCPVSWLSILIIWCIHRLLSRST